jgi:hypothetical protein
MFLQESHDFYKKKWFLAPQCLINMNLYISSLPIETYSFLGSNRSKIWWRKRDMSRQLSFDWGMPIQIALAWISILHIEIPRRSLLRSKNSYGPLFPSSIFDLPWMTHIFVAIWKMETIRDGRFHSPKCGAHHRTPLLVHTINTWRLQLELPHSHRHRAQQSYQQWLKALDWEGGEEEEGGLTWRWRAPFGSQEWLAYAHLLSAHLSAP